MPSSPTPAIPAPLNFRKSRRVSRSALFIPYLPFPLGCVGSFQSYIVTYKGSMRHNQHDTSRLVSPLQPSASACQHASGLSGPRLSASCFRRLTNAWFAGRRCLCEDRSRPTLTQQPRTRGDPEPGPGWHTPWILERLFPEGAADMVARECLPTRVRFGTNETLCEGVRRGYEREEIKIRNRWLGRLQGFG